MLALMMLIKRIFVQNRSIVLMESLSKLWLLGCEVLWLAN